MAISRINSNSISDGTVIASDILDGTISSSKLVSANINGDRLLANTLSNTVFQTGSVESYLNSQSGGALSGRNRIINGAMTIDQRNAGAVVTPTNGSYTLDRWCNYIAQSAKYSVQQDSSANTVAGFTSSMKVVSLSSYSVTSTDQFNINQAIEGLNFADMRWGTANAAPITLSFWVRSSLTGTFGGCVRNYGITRSYPFSYTIVAADTWEKKTITIAGDTSGTWIGPTNAGSTFLTFSLGAGATLTNTAGAWAAGNYTNSTGSTSVVGTSGATWYITGVQVEKGSVATPFEWRQYGTELALCQRYFQLATSAVGIGANTTVIQAMFTYGTPMRTLSPTVNETGVLTFTDGFSINPVQSSVSFSLNGTSYNHAYVQLNNFSSIVQTKVYTINTTTNALSLSAEL